MKAKEAPEKIYIQKRNNYKGYDSEWTFIPLINEDNVEYIRIDAFIKKACEWLSKHAIKYYLDGSKILGTDELVEDFKIAMTL